ncbi:MAG: D-aminoacyl-tRNA deacylase [Candidatus Falkowbacteria bacterium]|nr:D-aminoacyl-tRNA deacylase [Candidatus Falkowbacteria bacterium]
MRCLIQRVNHASVKINESEISHINNGLLVFVAIHVNDAEESISKMAEKIIKLRIFEDETGKMNKSVLDINGEVLVVSQFTLYGDCSKGNRPSFIESASPDKAKQHYDKFIKYLSEKDIKIQTGQFQAHMKIELTNDGPVTVIVET